MNLYHAVVLCRRDSHLVPWHIEHVNALGIPMRRCCYYGMDPNGERPTIDQPWQIAPFLELYENLPLKTYWLLKHALTVPEWTHLLKTDVNSYPTFIDLAKLQVHHLIGFRSTTTPSRVSHLKKVCQAGLAEPYMGRLPPIWCGGPAYAISRLLAIKIVERGAWAARTWPYEDTMVAQIALDEGWTPEAGIGYFTDGHEHRN